MEQNLELGIGDYIKAYRIDLGLSQKQLGEKLRISQAMITAWENNRSKPNTKRLKELADFFGIDIRALIPDSSVEHPYGTYPGWRKELHETADSSLDATWEKLKEEFDEIEDDKEKLESGFSVILASPNELELIQNYRQMNKAGKYKLLMESELIISDPKYYDKENDSEDTSE